ncbi:MULTISPECIES: heme ABC exporter ATP-binding protein CcmA [unclassified Marivivens]|jgi:heme exporter protein A|uniref:heme ABC exporter ATP-binding protein CcmA n=1 Tax=unclassified Marivivens TaxID=2622455 RepID=UPI0007FFDEB3|nr:MULTISPECIES: heme ABC exporter ATP-binding protein CcmA [unclassified Marivivens]MCL7406103.1 heme ABC exporter ATP-binding protein CcmA [Marivivens geojensis]OBR39691.1 heme ABC exporter, ATP-binding protein CcmA [Donghicola sp. JL3646]APO86964.1 heme ABC exporter, ATP-binding protein CcmA [Marivivens sp. JLT3646]NBQ50896.1 heme ABC exporter ATP-binding protein CcmA [Marivivens sp.]NCW69125.1 heme ABC exporter ATP-binding protein CcmA [Marivivens sp.]
MRLAVTDLACARGGVPVLSGVSFTVEAGQALVLRGANGIGKTTLLRTLAGLQPALSGEIDLPDDQAAYASHADGIKAQLSVEENLSFWAEVYGNPVPDTIYEAFDLVDLRHRMAGTLSAGQKRRLGLSRLGVIGRKVLFLDEPTVSLDRFSVNLFADFIRDQHLAKGGIAVIATHIDLGLDAPELDLEPFRASADQSGGSDEAFL